jgi:hypothetical protein
LQDGPRGFRPGFTCPTLLGYRIGGLQESLRDYHPLWCHFPKDFGSNPSIPRLRPHNPRRCPARFGLVPVRSPLLRESRLISFPPGTEMFQFPGLLGYSRLDARWAAPLDLSQPSTPDLLMTPRHSPRALRSLTTPIGPPLLTDNPGKPGSRSVALTFPGGYFQSKLCSPAQRLATRRPAQRFFCIRKVL